MTRRQRKKAKSLLIRRSKEKPPTIDLLIGRIISFDIHCTGGGPHAITRFEFEGFITSLDLDTGKAVVKVSEPATSYWGR